MEIWVKSLTNGAWFCYATIAPHWFGGSLERARDAYQPLFRVPVTARWPQ